MRQILAARVIPEICCPQGSKQPRWSSVSPSWIDPAAIRVNKTESRSEACLNRLLQQNLPIGDIRATIGRSSSYVGLVPIYKKAG